MNCARIRTFIVVKCYEAHPLEGLVTYQQRFCDNGAMVISVQTLLLPTTQMKTAADYRLQYFTKRDEVTKSCAVVSQNDRHPLPLTM